MDDNTGIFLNMGAPTWSPGYWACMQALVGFLNYCELTNPIGYKVFFEQGLYLDPGVGPNWFEYFFEPIEMGQPGDRIEHMSDVQKSAWNTDAISTMSRERAGEIINKYIKLKPHMQQKVDNIVNLYYKDHYVIGVHMRLTDKSSEAPRVPFEVMRDEILRVAATHSNYRVFLATDEQNCLNYMKHHFKDRLIYTDAIRSTNYEPVHHNHGKPMANPYKLGEDAVLDCYLLSKTNILVRTQSNLSSSAANINPNLQVIDLNKAHYREGLR